MLCSYAPCLIDRPAGVCPTPSKWKSSLLMLLGSRLRNPKLARRCRRSIGKLCLRILGCREAEEGGHNLLSLLARCSALIAVAADV